MVVQADGVIFLHSKMQRVDSSMCSIPAQRTAREPPWAISKSREPHITGDRAVCGSPAEANGRQRGLEAGQFRPMIAKTFAFDQSESVAAYRYRESHQRIGKIVVTVIWERSCEKTPLPSFANR